MKFSSSLKIYLQLDTNFVSKKTFKNRASTILRTN
jgi:hypothetical protein